jgi:DNA gyrase/topoisomerase IV subunit B
MDIIKFNQKTFLQKHTLGISKTKSLTNKEISMLFMRNADYIYFLEKTANTYAVNPYLLQLVLFHYVTNKSTVKFDKLKKEVASSYRFMDVVKKSGIIAIQGTIDKYNSIIMNDKFINDCKDILEIICRNDELVYLLDGKKTSLYDIMKVYNSTIPNGLQRYKGLGEMPREQLAESTLLPENRTLIQYTLEDAKALLHDIREYESDTKKILATITSVNRDDLVE